MGRGSRPTWWWGSITVLGVIVLGSIDWITGVELNFFVFYFVPISLAAWFMGLGASLSLAVLSSLVWFGADALSGHTYSTPFYAVWNTTIRLIAFIAIGVALSKIRQLLDRERQLVENLQRALSEIKILEAYLSICCECKKIRDQDGRWHQLEKYISEHSQTQFSHSFCPECEKKFMEKADLTKE